MPEDVKPWEKYQNSSPSTDTTSTVKPWEKYKAPEPEPVAPAYKPEPSFLDKVGSTVDSGLRLAANATGMGEGPITALETGAKNLAGLPGQVYHAFSDPSKPEEDLGPNLPLMQPHLGLQRLLLDPSKQHLSQIMPNVENANTQASQGNLGGALKSTGLATAHAAGVLPGVGQLVSDPAVMALEGKPWEAAGTLGSNLLIGKGIETGLGKLNGEPVSPVVNKAKIDNLSTFFGDSPQTGRSSQARANNVYQIGQEAWKRLNVDPSEVSTKNRAGKLDQFGDLYRGLPAQKHVDVLGAESHFQDNSPKPLPIAWADTLVKLADQPISEAMRQYGHLPMPEVQAKIEAHLRGRASEYLKVDKSLSDAYSAMADKVRDSDGTAGALNDLKSHSNQEANSLFSKSPSGMSAASATPIIAWKELGDSVRNELYPELDKQLGDTKLREHTSREADAMALRDGIYKEWAEAAGESSSDALKSYIGRVMGPSPGRAVVSSGARAGMASRAILPGPDALKDFNTRFKNSFGTVKGYVTPPPAVANKTITNPRRLLESGLPLPPNTDTSGQTVTQGQPLVRGYQDYIQGGGQASGGVRTGLNTPTVADIMNTPVRSEPGSVYPNQGPKIVTNGTIAGSLQPQVPPQASDVLPLPVEHPTGGSPIVTSGRMPRSLTPRPPAKPPVQKPVQNVAPSNDMYTSPSGTTNQATSTTDVRYMKANPTDVIKSTGMFDYGIMPGGTQLQMPLAQQLKRLGKRLPTGLPKGK